VTGLLDTNVALYLLGGRLASPLPPGDYGVSVITQMELLSWPSLTKEETKCVNAFLSTLTLCDLTPAIQVWAVSLRREERLKLPDGCGCRFVTEIQRVEMTYGAYYGIIGVTQKVPIG
jgi:predicted nucleic acid-binding protein